MRIAFFGTPSFAVPTLDALADSRHELVVVVTQPDRPRGRGQKVTFAPVKARATTLGLPILQPDTLRDEAWRATFAEFGVDLAVVAAYGKILPRALLDTPRLGMINVHASLLPRWRGAAPVHRAILAGDTETGVTIMRVVAALDAGPMLAREATPIRPDETSAELEARLAAIGARLLVPVVDAMDGGGSGPAEAPQDESVVTYAQRIERADGDLAWTQPARAVHDRIRGLHPWPHASAVLHGKRVLLIESRVETEAATAAAPGAIVDAGPSGIVVAARPGAVRLLRLQPEGRAVMTARDFLNGHPVHQGDRLEPPARPS